MKLGKYIAGALSGLTFGLLFAPKKGGDLRDEIIKKSKKSKQEAFTVLVEAFKEAGTEALEEAKMMAENESLENAIGNSKKKMKEYLTQIEKTGYDIAARAKEKLEEMQEMASEAGVDFKKEAVRKAQAVKKSVISKSKKVVSQAKKSVTGKTSPKIKNNSKKTKTIKPKIIRTTVKKISKGAKK